MQTFVLAPQTPNKYYVHNDIFRYQDEVFADSDEEDELVEENAESPEKQSSTHGERCGGECVLSAFIWWKSCTVSYFVKGLTCNCFNYIHANALPCAILSRVLTVNQVCYPVGLTLFSDCMCMARRFDLVEGLNTAPLCKLYRNYNRYAGPRRLSFRGAFIGTAPVSLPNLNRKCAKLVCCVVR